jgi:hypothetical protein
LCNIKREGTSSSWWPLMLLTKLRVSQALSNLPFLTSHIYGYIRLYMGYTMAIQWLYLYIYAILCQINLQ